MSISIGPKGQAFVQHAQKQVKVAEGEFSPGKSADSVGQRAKAMVKAMVAESGDTSPNAIGRAASMIARMDVTVLAPPPVENESSIEEEQAGTGLVDTVDASDQEVPIGPVDLEPEEDESA